MKTIARTALATAALMLGAALGTSGMAAAGSVEEYTMTAAGGFGEVTCVGMERLSYVSYDDVEAVHVWRDAETAPSRYWLQVKRSGEPDAVLTIGDSADCRFERMSFEAK